MPATAKPRRADLQHGPGVCMPVAEHRDRMLTWWLILAVAVVAAFFAGWLA